MDGIIEKAKEYAENTKKEWVSVYVGPSGYTYDEGEAFIRDPVKFEQSMKIYLKAYHDYLDKNTVRIPTEMVVFSDVQTVDTSMKDIFQVRIIRDVTGQVTKKRMGDGTI
jgi:hypothetical protein